MIAQSVKYRDYSCFQGSWVGFDEFKPITVIIGRNNSGKSHLLSLVEVLTKPNEVNEKYLTSGSGILDEDFLRRAFHEHVDDYRLGTSPWGNHGVHFIDAPILWNLGTDNSDYELSLPDRFSDAYFTVVEARVDAIKSHLPGIKSPLTGKAFRHILADRDIVQEKNSNALKLASNGLGATNIIRRYITSSNLSETLIQNELLEALDEIFGGDGDFQKIEIRQHDETEEGGNLWEVFLGEPKKKGLIPLSSSGSGLKTVILVLLNLLVIPKIDKKEKHEYVFAFEELENNLHPSLLRRLFKFIFDYVKREKCFVFFTTHSSVALDYFSTLPESQIIHVSHDGESATAKTVTGHFERVELVNELGARPSDLLQANGVIWLEGPSDRIYLNCFINLFSDGTLREGRDYQCVFYGGSNLANSTFSAPGESDETFANLLRLNSNIAVVCDGDRTAASGKGSRIKDRVQRIKKEVEQIPEAFLWITDAKEIENYIPGSVWASIYKIPSVPDPGKYDKFPTSNSKETDFVQKKLKRKSFDKCDFAMKAASHLTRDALSNRFEIENTMVSLVDKIKAWNN